MHRYCRQALSVNHFERFPTAVYTRTSFQLNQLQNVSSSSALVSSSNICNLPRNFSAPAAHSISRRESELKRLNPSSSPSLSPKPRREISFYDNSVEEYAQRPMTQVSIRQMIDFGRSITPEKLMTSARHIQEELPKRIARRLIELHRLPYVMVTNPFIKQVYEIYVNIFERLRLSRPIENEQDEMKFTHLLEDIVGDTVQVVDLLARGTAEVTRKVEQSTNASPFTRARNLDQAALNLDSFLRNMILSRISRRVLTEQHIMLHHSFQRKDPHESTFVGIIDMRCSIVACIEKAFQRASTLCQSTYGYTPSFRIRGNLRSTLPYIPAHLEFISFEIIKNAMRAVVEKKQQNSSTKKDQSNLKKPISGDWSDCTILFESHPKNSSSSASVGEEDIEILISEGLSETTIRFSDNGLGIPPESLSEVFRFGYSTARSHSPWKTPSSYSSPPTLLKPNDIVRSSSSLPSSSFSSFSSTTVAEGLALHPSNGIAEMMEQDQQVSEQKNLDLLDQWQRWQQQQQKQHMAGLGFGLPLAQVYAQYFGGEVEIVSTFGSGSDVYLRLDRTGSKHEHISV